MQICLHFELRDVPVEVDLNYLILSYNRLFAIL